MKIKDVLALDVGITGFSVEAFVLNVYDVKELTGAYGEFKKQSIKLCDPDTDDTIFVRLSGGFLTKEDVTKPITITNLTLTSYKDEKQLDTNKKSTVGVDRTAKLTTNATTVRETTVVTAKPESITVPKTFAEIVDEAIVDVKIILDNPNLALLLENYTVAGKWSSEDLRAMLISRLINKERKW